MTEPTLSLAITHNQFCIWSLFLYPCLMKPHILRAIHKQVVNVGMKIQDETPPHDTYFLTPYFHANLVAY